MDKKKNLEYSKFYEDLEKNKKKVKTIEIGLNFLDFFYEELGYIESACHDPSSTDLVSIKIYDYRKKKFKTIKVSSKKFQNQFQFIYREFIEKNYFINYSWYKSFFSVLEKILKTKYGYHLDSSISLVISFVSDSFRFLSTGLNNYNYDKVYLFIFNKFKHEGCPDFQSEDFSKTFLDCLFESKLLIYNSDSNSQFKLSDPCMDLVFNLNSLFIGHVFRSSEQQNEYNSRSLISEEFSVFLNKYSNNFLKRQAVSQSIFRISINFAELADQLLDYYILILAPIPKHVDSAVYCLFFYKVLINEYCLQLVMLSCFDFFFLKKNMRNILFLESNNYIELFK